MADLSFGESVRLYEDELNTRYATLSAFTIIIYDHLLTIDEEVKLVWNRRCSLGQILFLMIRYYNVFIVGFDLAVEFNPLPSLSLCRVWMRWQFITGMIVFGLTETILQMRLYVMYGKSKKLLAFIGPACLGCLAVAAFMANQYLTISPDYVQALLISGSYCAGGVHRPPPFKFWISIICYETLLGSLAIYKGYKAFRESAPVAGWSGTKLLEILIRDSILYFLVIFAVYATNLIVWLLRPDTAEPPVNYAIALPTIMTQRLLFNISRSVDPRVDVTTITTVHYDLDFASHPDESQDSCESRSRSFREREVAESELSPLPVETYVMTYRIHSLPSTLSTQSV